MELGDKGIKCFNDIVTSALGTPSFFELSNFVHNGTHFLLNELLMALKC